MTNDENGPPEEDIGDVDELEPGEDEDTDEKTEDPDKQGIIRTVDHAHLVYKRQSDEGSYEELWLYKTDDAVNDELEIRRDILSATDIPEKKMKSDDGSQYYELWTVGNVQYLNIFGLPN